MKKQTLEGTMLTPMQLQEKAVKIYNRIFGSGPNTEGSANGLRIAAADMLSIPTDKNQLAKVYLALLNHAQRIGVSADALQILASQRIRIDELKLDNESNQTS